MEVTRVCADDLNECVQAAEDALLALGESVDALRCAVLSDEDRRAEGECCLNEAAKLWGAALGIAQRLGLWPTLQGLHE